ncbi:MAG TPA: hypothetical protein DIW27_12780 [Cytophagales bacterium]|nr:hypothetical protein [Cytophagales bacterium]
MKSVIYLVALFVGFSANAFDCEVTKISSKDLIPSETMQVTDWASIYSKPGTGHFTVGSLNGYRFIQVVKNKIVGENVDTNSSGSDVGAWTAGVLSAQDVESDSKITCNFK